VTSTDDATVTWLTQEAYDRLSKELEALIANRPAMAKEINDRREEGDLKENGGYHAAREEQGKVEGRIRQLEDMLQRAQVGETPADDGIVEPGMKVTYKFVGDDDDEAETFLLGAREMEETTDGLQVFSPQSPLGAAIIGAKKGDTVSYAAPHGKELKVEIVDAVPYTG